MSNVESKTALVKYIFLDIVGYSFNRTVEAQTDIISTLNTIIQTTLTEEGLKQENMILLPTGDGICIALINLIDPYDLHISIGIKILSKLEDYNLNQPSIERIFKIRIGINENYDNIISDINGRENVAGTGINIAQRIMDSAEANQLLIGQSVYEKLAQRSKYSKAFISFKKKIKHGIELHFFRYINNNIAGLNSEVFIQEKTVETYPKFIAIYCSLLIILKKQIYEFSSPGGNYALMLTISYLTEDIINYNNASDIDKKNFNSKLMRYEIDSLKGAYKAFKSTHFWVLADAWSYQESETEIYKWRSQFKNDYLTLIPEAEEKLFLENPNILEEVNEIIKNIFPNFYKI
ncbi:hypothetical protein ACO2KH_18230 [Leptospira terpstrae]|uniref:hypothetical protein n=1 Tax=Leptospira terpstrae TaxID=293075 RepID=UPI003D021D7F